MPVIDVQQQTPEWLTMRIGMITGSRAAAATKKLKKGGYSAERETLLWQIVTERMTGRAIENHVSYAMEWGIEHEPQARTEYELATGVTVQDGQFAVHDRIKWFGASADGLIGEDGCLEIKCPNSITHLQYIVDGCVPADYLPQIKAQMACYNRQWCDFVSFDPRMPPEYQLFVRRLERDEPMIVEMEKEVELFLGEVDKRIADVHLKREALVVTSLVGESVAETA